MRMYNLNWNLKEYSNAKPLVNDLNQVPSKSFTYQNPYGKLRQILSFYNFNNINFDIERKTNSRTLFTKIGDTIEDIVMPKEFFNFQFYVDSSRYVKFNLTLSKSSYVGIYGAKNSAPSFTKYKFFEAFNGDSLMKQNLKSQYQVICSFENNFIKLI